LNLPITAVGVTSRIELARRDLAVFR